MAANWGIRYVIVGVGTLKERATDVEAEWLHKVVSERINPLEARMLSERVSNKLTIALLQEQGAL